LGQRSYLYIPGETPLFSPSDGYISWEGINKTLTSASKALRQGTVYDDYTKAIRGAMKGDVILSDSPYMGVRGYSSVTADVPKWTAKHNIELDTLLKGAKEKGVSGLIWTSEQGKAF